MTFDELKADLDAKLAKMTDEELIEALKRAGCVFEEINLPEKKCVN